MSTIKVHKINNHWYPSNEIQETPQTNTDRNNDPVISLHCTKTDLIKRDYGIKILIV